MTHERRFTKKIRLPRSAYEEPGTVWHVTIGTHERQRFFVEARVAEMVCTQVEWYGERYDLFVPAYCLMPDHLHLIAQVGSKDLIVALNAFKSWTTRQAWELGISGQIWQSSFHDHGLRQLDDFDSAAKYLFQ
ncbi:MAG: transposase, partial [Chloroflexota bacterium]|nr:transposase [Chloroflexota bacterium]